jgi:hypothetical protein
MMDDMCHYCLVNLEGLRCQMCKLPFYIPENICACYGPTGYVHNNEQVGDDDNVQHVQYLYARQLKARCRESFYCCVCDTFVRPMCDQCGKDILVPVAENAEYALHYCKC